MILFTKYYPAPQLREYIHSYFLIAVRPDGSDLKQQSDFSYNHPQGTMDLMFALKGGIHLSNFKGDLFELNNIFLMAQQEGYFGVSFLPNSYILGVVFYAESFSKLFNLPLAELTNIGCTITDNLNQRYLELFQKLGDQSNVSSQIALLNQFLYAELSGINADFQAIDQLIRHIRLGTGTESIQQLAYLANMSERSLQRKLKEAIGMRPKAFSRVIRFKNVLLAMNKQPEHNWQDILYNAGYFDQAHFIKDFKHFTGTTPSQFIKSKGDLSKLFLEP